MKAKVNLDWIKNLYELGAPIRDEAKEIGWRMEAAEKELENAKRIHRERMKEIARSAQQLERTIGGLWSTEEIEAAKRGVMLINGMEVSLE